MKTNFIKYRAVSFAISGVLVAVSLVLLAIFGLKPGLDFTGGTLVSISFFADKPDIQRLTTVLDEAGVYAPIIQTAGESGYIVKTTFLSEQERENLNNSFEKAFSSDGEKNFTIDRFERVGGIISSELKNRSMYAGVAVLVMIVVYVAYTFRRVSRSVSSWKYGLIAIVALAHDLIITLGALAVLGRVAGVEISVPIVVALLTILGYSVNDTIIVFDRIRENILKRGGDDFGALVEVSIGETMFRSFGTSFTTLLTLFAVYLFGGDSTKAFALTLLIGIAVGTYSSIFVASPLLVFVKEKTRG